MNLSIFGLNMYLNTKKKNIKKISGSVFIVA